MDCSATDAFNTNYMGENTSMNITFDPTDANIYVQHESGEVESLRDFYIRQRQSSGKTIGEVQRLAGVNHPTLWTVENHLSNGKPNQGVKSLLAGLEALGYEIILQKQR